MEIYRKKYLKYKKKYLDLKAGALTSITEEQEREIIDSDIMYQDDLVCILKPDIKKGILVRTHYTPHPPDTDICDVGLKTGAKLHDEGINFGRSIYHPYIFFRAPFFSRDIDYTTIESEIISSYGNYNSNYNNIYIRVDPDRTFVFSSEIRNYLKHTLFYGKVDKFIVNSKKKLSEYLKVIESNLKIEQNIPEDKNLFYNLYSSKVHLFPKKSKLETPYDNEPINKNSEILVSAPHLTPDYFVLCTKRKPVSPIIYSSPESYSSVDDPYEMLDKFSRKIVEEPVSPVINSYSLPEWYRENKIKNKLSKKATGVRNSVEQRQRILRERSDKRYRHKNRRRNQHRTRGKDTYHLKRK